MQEGWYQRRGTADIVGIVPLEARECTCEGRGEGGGAELSCQAIHCANLGGVVVLQVKGQRGIGKCGGKYGWDRAEIRCVLG